eukprot:scaffold51435_cov63-Attheya_sp.AAC.3
MIIHDPVFHPASFELSFAVVWADDGVQKYSTVPVVSRPLIMTDVNDDEVSVHYRWNSKYNHGYVAYDS